MAKARLDVDVLNADELAAELLTEVLTAGTRNVGAATRRLEQDLEAQTRTAAGGKAWRAWKSAVYPRGGRAAYQPVGEVFGNGGSRTQGMLEYWSLPGTNRAKGGGYLAVPLKAAQGSGNWREMTPRKWEARFKAKLRPLFRPGKTPLLVADGAISAGGFVPASRTAAMRRGGQSFKRQGTIAVFALIEVQEHANKVSIEAAHRRASEYMIETLGRRIARIGA